MDLWDLLKRILDFLMQFLMKLFKRRTEKEKHEKTEKSKPLEPTLPSPQSKIKYESKKEVEIGEPKEEKRAWIIKASWHPPKIIGNLDGKEFMKDIVKVSALAEVIWKSDPNSEYHLVDGEVIVEIRTFKISALSLELDDIITKTYKISGASGVWRKRDAS